jgi:hypothetical protein
VVGGNGNARFTMSDESAAARRAMAEHGGSGFFGYRLLSVRLSGV